MMSTRMFVVTWLLFVSLILIQDVTSNGLPPNLAIPEQVHLSLADKPSGMTITWTTPIALSNLPVVEFGKTSMNLDRAVNGVATQWTYAGIVRYTHTATLYDLEYNTTYYYQVGSREQGWSHVFHFRTFPEGNDFPLRICIFGDLGYFNGTSMPYLQKAVQRDEFDLVIHVGDIAYDLHTDNGNRGDLFMRQIEPIAAYVPYMVVAGNHEDDGENFTNYIHRFNMPNCPFADNQVYSVDVGPIHLLALSTEYHGFFYEYGIQAVMAQNEWMKQDLKTANANRDQVPWIVTYQHRPFYCSNQNSYECRAFENRLIRIGYESMPGFEDLLVDGGVDLGFWGHEHSYERFWPVSDRRVFNLTSNPYHNAAAPVYIVSGSAGCHSGRAWFSEDDIAPASAKRLNDYGYSILHVHNGTHLHVSQVSVESGTPTIVDDVWVTKTKGHVPSTQFASSQPFVPFPQNRDDLIVDNCRSCPQNKFGTHQLEALRKAELP